MNEQPEKQSSPLAGGKLSTIFLVVLGLHIVLIVAFSAYHLLKGNTDEIGMTPPAPVEAEAEAVAENAVAPEGAEPAVETSHEAVDAPEVAQSQDMPMPASSDPIWTRSPASDAMPVVAEETAQAETPAPAVASAPAPVAAPAPAAVAAPSTTYTVAKGDSLARISKKYGVGVADIKKANGLTSDMIKIGQSLSIPGAAAPVRPAATVASAPAPAPVSAPVAASSFTTYTVGKGDTLWKIAKQFNMKASDLASMNKITDPSKLKVGMSLKVPAAGARQEVATPPAARPQAVPVLNTDMAMVRD